MMLLCIVKSKVLLTVLYLNNICSWATKWQLHLNASKCAMLLISNKRKPLTSKYSINDTPLSWHSSVKYLGICIQSHLSWSNHCRMLYARANCSLNFLHHSLWGTNTTARSVAYKYLIRPLLEYACQVWHPYTVSDISMLESVQRCVTRWVCGSRWNPSIKQWTISSDDFLAELHWPTLAACSDYLSVCLLHDIFNKKMTLNFSDYCTRNTSCTRAHNLCIVPPQSTAICYHYSFLYALLFMEYSSS